jgi:hypothetical protein
MTAVAEVVTEYDGENDDDAGGHYDPDQFPLNPHHFAYRTEVDDLEDYEVLHVPGDDQDQVSGRLTLSQHLSSPLRTSSSNYQATYLQSLVVS